MKFLTALRIYVFPKISINKFKNNLFELFLLKKIKKENIKEIQIVHSWDFIPKVYELLKNINPKIKIVQDVSVAFNSILKNQQITYIGQNTDLEQGFKKSKNLIDIFIVPSTFVKKSLINEGINKNKIKVIPFGVNAQYFKPLNEIIR